MPPSLNRVNEDIWEACKETVITTEGVLNTDGDHLEVEIFT